MKRSQLKQLEKEPRQLKHIVAGRAVGVEGGVGEEVVRAQIRREVLMMQGGGVSQRRACGLMEIDRWGRAGIGALVKKVVFETGFKAAAWKRDWNIALNWCSAEQIDRPGLFHRPCSSEETARPSFSFKPTFPF